MTIESVCNFKILITLWLKRKKNEMYCPAQELNSQPAGYEFFFFIELSPLLIGMVQLLEKYKIQDSFSPVRIFILLLGEPFPFRFNLHSQPHFQDFCQLLRKSSGL